MTRSGMGASVRHTALTAVQIALAAVLFTLLLVLAERHNRRFDLTPTQSFVLSDESTTIAKSVGQPVRVTVFYNSQEHGQRRQTEDLLQLFSDASPRISYRLLDLDRSPALAKKYGVSSFNTGVVESGQESRPLTSVDEEEITKALLQLNRGEQRVLCFLTAHGEHSPQDAGDRTGYSEVAKALEKENFEIRTLDSAGPAGLPADCSAVVLAGPRRNLLPGEADRLSQYLDAGGRLLVLIDPDAPPSVIEFLHAHGVDAGNDIVVDERNRLYGADSFMPRVPIFDEGTFRKNLDTAAVFALARTVAPTEAKASDRTVLLLALTSPESWAYVDGGVVPDGQVRFRRDRDRPGPLPVGVMVVEEHSPTPAADNAAQINRSGRMIVFGDSDFPSNLYLNLLGNKDLFMSSVGVLAEDAQLIAMRRKGLPRSSLSPISLTARQGRLIFWMAVIIEPAGLAVFGLLVTLRRRRRGSR